MTSLSSQAPPGHVNVSPLIYRPKTTMQLIAGICCMLMSSTIAAFRLAAVTKTALHRLARQIYQNPRLLFAPVNALYAHFKRLSALEIMQMTTLACLLYRLPIRVAIILWDTLCAASSVLFWFCNWSTSNGIDFPWILSNWVKVVFNTADLLIFLLIALVLIVLFFRLVVAPMFKKNGEEEVWESPNLALTVEEVTYPGFRDPFATPASRKAAYDAREEERQREDLRYRKEQQIQQEQLEMRRSANRGSIPFELTVPIAETTRLQEELAAERFLNSKLQREVAELRTRVARMSPDMIDGEHPNAQRSGGRTRWSFGQLLAKQREDCRQKEFYMGACRTQLDEIQELKKQLKDTTTKSIQDLEFVRRKLIAADAKAGEHTRLRQEFEAVKRRLEVSEDRRKQASERQRAVEKAARRR